jgi:hypothetical protein
VLSNTKKNSKRLIVVSEKELQRELEMEQLEAEITELENMSSEEKEEEEAKEYVLPVTPVGATQKAKGKRFSFREIASSLFSKFTGARQVSS